MKNVVLSILVTGLLFFTSQPFWAQEGPGGVGSSSSVGLWLRADEGVSTSGGSNVDSWADQSGNGNNATASNSDRPTLISSDANYNSMPTLGFGATFSTGNNIMAVADDNTLDPSQISTFLVGQYSQTVNWEAMFIKAASTSWVTGGYGMSRRINGSRMSFWIDRWDNESAFLSTAANTATIMIGEYDQSNVSFRLNGGTAATNAYTPANSNTASDLYIGGDAGTSTFLNGKVAEFIIFQQKVSETERILVQNYLSSKYGIAVSDDHYAFDAGHGHEVFGVGHESGSTAHTDARGSGIVQISSPSAMVAGEYMLVGHDNAGLGTTTVDVPAGFTASNGSRFNQVWRVSEQSGDVGNVTIVFHLASNGFGNENNYVLLTDTDGTFATGATETTGGTWSDANKTITYTGVNLTDSIFFTLGNSKPERTIKSAASTAWNLTTTWDCACEPNQAQDSVVISHDVTLTADALTGDLNILGGGSLTVTGSATLTISDMFENAGTFDAGSGTVRFAGDGINQKITNSSGTLTFFDIEIDNASGVTASSGNFALENSITLTNGDFTNGGTFTFLSDGTRTARVGTVASPSASSLGGGGTYNVERFIATRAANWGGLGTPNDGVTVADWDDDLVMSGVGGNEGDACCPIFRSVYTYDEPTDAYVALTSLATSIPRGVGTEIYLATNQTQLNATTITTSGAISLADFALPLSSGGGGWNLLSNPYPGAISWTSFSSNNSDITSGNINDNFRVYDATTSQYITYTDGDVIPTGQSFWVFALSGSLTARVSDISTSTASTFLKKPKEESYDGIKLKLTGNSTTASHETVVKFGKENSYALEENLDLRFLISPNKEAPNMTTICDDQKVIVNTLPNEDNQVVVPMRINVGIGGIYTIETASIENLESYECVMLEDLKTGTFTDLKEQESYSFYATPDQVDMSFNIHFAKNGIEDCKLPSGISFESDPVSIYNSQDQVFVDFMYEDMTEVEVSIFNLLGQQLTSEQTLEVSTERVSINVPPSSDGLYVVIVKTSTGTYSKKLKF